MVEHARFAALVVVASAMFACVPGCQKPAVHEASLNADGDPMLGVSTPDASSRSDAGGQPASERALVESITRSTWQFGDATGTLITTPNYRLYTTVETPTFLERLPLFYERALVQYTTALAPLPKPDRKLETFLFATRRQWQAKTVEMLPDQASMFANLGRGGFTTRGTSVLYYIDRYGYPRDTFAIAAHEGWHQYTQQTFRHQLPIWLEEGIATYMEGYRRDSEQLPEFNAAMNYERRQTLYEARSEDDLIPLDQLLTRTPQSFLNESKDALLTYYAQVWALTRYLAEGEDGRFHAALERILLDAANGKLVGRMSESAFIGPRRKGVGFTRVGPAVVQEYFNADLAAFETGYLAYVEQLTAQRNEWRGPGRRDG